MRWRLAGALLVVALSGCHWRPQTVDGRNGTKNMRVEAGELSLEMPSGWHDTSDYSYASQDDSITLRISRLTVTEAVSVTDLLNDRKERLNSLGNIKELQSGEQQIDSVPAKWVELNVDKTDPDEEDEESHIDVRLLVARPSPRQAVVATMTGPARRQAEIARLWQQILGGLRFRRVQ